MRLMARSRVDLPQPDGPMIAVTRFGGNAHVDVLERVALAVVEIEVADIDRDRGRRLIGGLQFGGRRS